MRTIDADPVQDQYIAKMEEIIKSTTTPNISLEALSLLCGYALIMDAPTIEQCKYWDNESNFCGLYRPAATKHGQWLSIKVMDDEADFGETDGAECSVCGCTINSEYWAKTYYHYCPNCGADMRGGENE